MSASGDKKNYHKDHRQRMRERFLNSGIDSFAEHEILELLLYAAIPQQDVNTLAHQLIQEFGNITNVFSAPVESLKKVKGVGDHVAVTIKLVSEIYRYIEIKSVQNETFPDPDSWYSLFKVVFIGATCEHVYMLCLDSKYRRLSLKNVGSGTAKNAMVNMSDIIKEAVTRSSTYVVLAHNHNSGSLVPSKQDLYLTQSVKQALYPAGIELLDHLIVTDTSYKSIIHSSYSISF